MTSPDSLEACSVAFKEWAGVCDALMSGRQSLILRKGGVSEGPGGFTPDHPAFWLYPTHVHEAEQGLRSLHHPRADGDPSVVPIEALAVVERVDRVESIEQLEPLKDLHDWTEATVNARFHYRTPGLWALMVRVYRRPESWLVAVTSAQLGCKTWVPLDQAPPTTGLVPVIGDAESARRLDRLASALRGRGVSC